MKERLLMFLKAERKTSAQLAEEIGVQPSGISHILSGRNKPSLDFVLKMLEKYKFLATDWLLFGKGNMYKEQGMQNLFEGSLENKTESSENELNVNPRQISKEESETNITEADGKTVGKHEVIKIVWFYSDDSFREFDKTSGY